MELLVLPLNRTVHAKPGANLLAVLKLHEIPISHSCTAGRCGTCRCKVLSGQVLPCGGELNVPTTNGDPYVLACQTVLTQDCTIEIPEPDEIVTHPTKALRATITALEPLTHDVSLLRLGLSKPLQYSPGQHAQLQFGPGLIRPYSMATISDQVLEFHVKQVPGGRVTQGVLKRLSVGDTIRVNGPMGAAYLRRRHIGPMICVAGGTGLAPILSILRGAIDSGMRNPLYVYFGVRSKRDLYGVDWLREVCAAHRDVHINLVLTTEKASEARSGLVTDAIASDWKSLIGFRAYVCGPPPLVEAASLVMQQRALPREHIYADAFYPTGT